MNCPNCQQPINIGKILSKVKSPAKARASRENGNAPVKKGSKPRGWPKGKKRNPKTK